jgi:hypothetical protein
VTWSNGSISKQFLYYCSSENIWWISIQPTYILL